MNWSGVIEKYSDSLRRRESDESISEEFDEERYEFVTSDCICEMTVVFWRNEDEIVCELWTKDHFIEGSYSSVSEFISFAERLHDTILTSSFRWFDYEAGFLYGYSSTHDSIYKTDGTAVVEVMSDSIIDIFVGIINELGTYYDEMEWYTVESDSATSMLLAEMQYTDSYTAHYFEGDMSIEVYNTCTSITINNSNKDNEYVLQLPPVGVDLVITTVCDERTSLEYASEEVREEIIAATI